MIMTLSTLESEGFANLFFIILFFIILYFIISFLSHQLKRVFPEEDKKQENFDEDLQESFLNLDTLQDYLYNMNDEDLFQNDSNNEDKEDKEDKEDLLEKINHPKNYEVSKDGEEKRREEEEKRRDEEEEKKREKEEKKSREEEEKKRRREDTFYLLDKNRNKYEILDSSKSPLYYINGYKDPYFVHQITNQDHKDVTILKNKIYNKYIFIYKTKADKEIKNYYIEYRSSQPRFIKIYDEDEKYAFYIEKIQYKSNDLKMDAIPLYHVYYYAEEIGKIYLDQSKNQNHTTYFLDVEKEQKPFREIILFGFILYLSLSKEE